MNIVNILGQGQAEPGRRSPRSRGFSRPRAAPEPVCPLHDEALRAVGSAQAPVEAVRGLHRRQVEGPEAGPGGGEGFQGAPLGGGVRGDVHEHLRGEAGERRGTGLARPHPVEVDPAGAGRGGGRPGGEAVVRVAVAAPVGEHRPGGDLGDQPVHRGHQGDLPDVGDLPVLAAGRPAQLVAEGLGRPLGVPGAPLALRTGLGQREDGGDHPDAGGTEAGDGAAGGDLRVVGVGDHHQHGGRVVPGVRGGGGGAGHTCHP